MENTKNNLYLIISEDKDKKNFYLEQILDKIENAKENKIIYDMDECSIIDIIMEASMPSLFSPLKVIIGNNLDILKLEDNFLDLVNYVDNYNKNVYIIFTSKKVDTRRKEYKLFKDKFNVISVDDDISKDIFSYVKNVIHDRKYEMNDNNIKYLLEKTGDNINNINNELNKLFVYKEESKTINRDDIDKIVLDNLDDIIYEFTNSVYDNDYDKIIKMYDDFNKENIGFDYLISSLSNSFRQALIVKDLYNKGNSNIEIAKIIGKKEFFVKKLLERIDNYTEYDLGNYINRLCEIDYRYKMGLSNIDELLLFLISKDN